MSEQNNQQAERTKMLGEAKIPKLLLNFSLPAMIAMLVNATYAIVDRIFIGQGVGEDALAAIGLTITVSLVILAFGMLVGIGSANVISIKLGQKLPGEAKRILNTNTVLVVLVSLLLTVLGLTFMEEILTLLNIVSDSQREYAREYLQIILGGLFFQIGGFSLNANVRATGNPRIAMYTMLIGALTNIILDPIFIFAFGWGVRGAAIATVISQFMSLAWVVWFLSSKHSIIRINPRFSALKWRYVKPILSIGMAPFALQLAASLVTMLFNSGFATYGTEYFGAGGDTITVAAFTIVNSVAMFIVMPIFGINQGMQPILGYNYGAKNYKRVIETYKIGCTCATLISTLGFVAVMLFAPNLVGVFLHDSSQATFDYTVSTMRTILFFLPLVGFQIVSSAYFQSIGKPILAGFLTLSRQLIYLLPLILILPLHFRLHGLMYAIPLADLLSTITTVVLISLEIKKLKAKEVEAKEVEAKEVEGT